ncbi:MAG: hypothetical protein HZB14_05460 [Actinobacteria bacterium]|nr:hypothetical protein [Actinomycetota bacterium]
MALVERWRLITMMALVLLAPLWIKPTFAPSARVERDGVLTFSRTLPVDVQPYQVFQGQNFELETPSADGHYSGREYAAILRMKAEIVDAEGRPLPVAKLMLHHIVFLNAGNANAGRPLRDATCDTLTFPDNLTTVPAIAERFYSTGEEGAVFDLPPGYGYKVRADDRWGALFMVMNHLPHRDRAFIRYTAEYVTGERARRLKGVRPFWMDVNNCKADPYYDVPGTGRPGSEHTRTSVWRAPEDLRLVVGQGHVHGGAKLMRLRRRDCEDPAAALSRPVCGAPDHAFYRVRPKLHEPGPIATSRFYSARGIPVAKGQRIELRSTYDARDPHTRVMGTYIGAYTPDGDITPRSACAEQPQVEYNPMPAGRTDPPRFAVPLFRQPTGPYRRLKKPEVTVVSPRLEPGRIELAAGQRLRWNFATPPGNDNLHDITLARGPVGFASPHLNQGRSFSYRFERPGKYELFCSLHPVQMTQVIRVRRQ